MRSPPVVFAGLGVVCGGACRDGGGSTRRCSPACHCSGVWGALPILIASAEGRGDRGVAHRGSDRAVQRCREAGVELERQSDVGLREKMRWRRLQTSRPGGGAPGEICEHSSRRPASAWTSQRGSGAPGPRRRGVLCSNYGSAAGAGLGFRAAEVRASSGRQRGYL